MGRDIFFAPVRKRRTFEEVFDKIKESILDRTLKPGDKLPSETHLAHQFRVGRQTIREALRILELSGFISIRKGGNGGPIVEDTVLAKISELLIDVIRLRRISISDLTVARIAIEKVILGSVFNHIEPSDVKNLQENISRTKRKIASGIHPLEQNIEFHLLLAKATKNHLFVVVLESIMTVLTDLMGRLKPDLQTARNTVGYHEKIVQAIKRMNQAEAMTLMEEHLLEVEHRLQAFSRRPRKEPAAGPKRFQKRSSAGDRPGMKGLLREH